MKTAIRNLNFDNVTMDEAVTLAGNLMQENTPHSVVTPNAEIAELCIENPDVLRAVSSADMLLPDGAGILMAAKILGTPLKEKVAGVDFGLRMLEYANNEHLKVYLLGGKEGVASLAKENLQKRFSSLAVVGVHNGYFAKEGTETDAVIDEINGVNADIVFVCLGAPAQEKWVYENKQKFTSARLLLCLGGSLDVYAGTVKRAPKFFIKMKLEWFYRLLKQPSRLPRMMKLPRYIHGAKKEARQKKKAKK